MQQSRSWGDDRGRFHHCIGGVCCRASAFAGAAEDARATAQQVVVIAGRLRARRVGTRLATLEEVMAAYFVSQVEEIKNGSGNAGLNILDDRGGVVAILVYANNHDALSARADLQAAIERTIHISTAS
jgi:hypothetical protein